MLAACIERNEAHERIKELESELAPLHTQVKQLQAALRDAPDHSDLDAAVFEANLLWSQVKQLREALSAAVEWAAMFPNQGTASDFDKQCAQDVYDKGVAALAATEGK